MSTRSRASVPMPSARPMLTSRPAAMLLSAALLMTGLLGACAPKKDRSALLKGIPTEKIRLEMEHTTAPDLEITVPKGFIANWAKEARYDKFYIYDPADTGVTQRGLLIVDLSPTPALSIPDSAKTDKSRGTIADESVTWREAVLKDETPHVHQREMVQKDLLGRYQSSDNAGPIILHAIIAGSDSTLVERLTASVESIKVLPAKPNL